MSAAEEIRQAIRRSNMSGANKVLAVNELDSSRRPLLADGSDASMAWKAERYHVLLEAQKPILHAIQGHILHGNESLGELAARKIREGSRKRAERDELRSLAEHRLSVLQTSEVALTKAREEADDAQEWAEVLAKENAKLRQEADEAKEQAESAARQTAEPLARVLAQTQRRAERAESRARFRGWILLALTAALSLGAALAATGVH